MAEIVVDTSVVVKWYTRNSIMSTLVRSVMRILMGRLILVAPALMPFEAVNALEYGGHYDGARLEEASRSLAEYGIDLVQFSNTGPVAEIATTLDITSYDAAYIALAQALDTTVYTADEALLDDLEGDCSEMAAHISAYA